MIYAAIDQIIGKTPLFEAVNIEKILSLKGKLLLKLEYLNPTGSVKDRAALYIINAAEETGRLKEGGTIIEPTSGNTGIGLAAIGASRGYRVIIVMPDTMSVERQKLIRAYGAEIILTEGKKGMSGAIQKADELCQSIPGSIIGGQFDNKANALAHYMTTGPEIWEDTEGRVDALVAGVGTGGTITGAGRYIKERNPEALIAAVEPEKSPVLSGGAAGPHPIQGIGAGFVPSVLDVTVYDEVIRVSEENAFSSARLLASKEGILTGISSGAALWAGIGIAREREGNTVVVLPDSGDRYLSGALYS